MNDEKQLLAWLETERDRREIEEVVKLYFASLDRRQPALQDRVFAADGRFWVAGQLLRGPGVTPGASPLASVGVPSKPIASTHAMHQCVIELAGDQARVETYATAYLCLDGDPRRILSRGLRYLDRFVRLPEGWRIAERRHTMDWMFESDAVVATPFEARLQANALG